MNYRFRHAGAMALFTTTPLPVIAQHHSIYGDKLKLMAGAEWARIENDVSDAYNGFTFLTGGSSRPNNMTVLPIT